MKRASVSNAFISAAIIFCSAVVLCLQLLSSQNPFTLPPRTITYTMRTVAPSDNAETGSSVKYSNRLFSTDYSRMVRSNTYYSLQTESSAPVNEVSVATPVTALANEIPINYTEHIYPSVPYPVYVFLDESGKMTYRVMLERSAGYKKERGYVQATMSIMNRKLCINFNENDPFVSLSQEPFGEITATEPDEEKIVGLQKVFGKTGVYQRLSTGELFVYGHYPSGEDRFYMADSNGNMIRGTLPIDIVVSEVSQ